MVFSSFRIALAFELLTPLQVCAAFSRALDRPCKYVWNPKIEIRVPTPIGYREQLEGIELLFGQMQAPYYPGDEWLSRSSSRHEHQGSDKGGSRERGKGIAGKDVGTGPRGGDPEIILDEARHLWEGWRGMEEYAREVFPVEEEANGLDWMI